MLNRLSLNGLNDLELSSEHFSGVSIQELYYKNASLTSIPNVTQLKDSLEDLYLSDNHITQLDGTVLGQSLYARSIVVVIIS